MLGGDAGVDVSVDTSVDTDDAQILLPLDGGCITNPHPTSECPQEQICGESCNGIDDDCDGRTDEDEGETPLCDLPHATAVCNDGHCAIVECEGRFRDCDNEPDNGCEASLDDVANCGACDAVCDIDRAIESCVNGACVPAGCELGYGDCDGNERTICETEVNTIDHCGACDIICESNHAVTACRDYACVVSRCENGYGNCDDDSDNGCEAPLDTLDDCGACNTPCALVSCAGGVCSAIVCTDPEADCDADGVTCETNLNTDASHCGACSAPCEFESGATPHASGLNCIDKQCEPVCDSGYGDCDSDYRNGCETSLAAAQNCGACGRNCDALLDNTSATSCTTAGVCEISTCLSGYADCDSDDQTGCETSIRTVSNCGGCSSTGENEPCTGLPNVTDSSCAAGTCVIESCADGYFNCDSVTANGCEPMTECFPDTNCTAEAYGDNIYYFCTNKSTWADARDKCRIMTRGDLVHIGDAAEDAFIHAFSGSADAWIGAGDAQLEGTWRWANNGVPFWRGLADGSTVFSRYNHWASGQPDDNGSNEDCGEIWTDGLWNDEVCSNTNDFICEVYPDLCPSDAAKYDPGQCGCGAPETDSDGDGVADCVDVCPLDPTKAENDSDSDGDGTYDCNDGCPLNASSTDASSGCGLGFVPVNIDVTRLNPNQAAATTTIDCNAVLNTDELEFTTWCTGETRPQITMHSQTDGPEVAVVALRGLNVTGSRTLKIEGSRPAVLVVFGNATIAGTVNASANGTTANAGGNYNCTADVDVEGCESNDNETGGGGGGGFGTAGGKGGKGDDCPPPSVPPGDGTTPGGPERGNGSLVPLIGGCPGGAAGFCSGKGAGGGALQLSIGGTLTLTGTLRANGGAGPYSCGSSSEGKLGGGGGGSGGAIRVEAGALSITGTVEAKGGNGGDSTYNGGSGSTSSSQPGGDASNLVPSPEPDVYGGGGGGGGYGRIVLCDRTTNNGCP